MKNIILLVISLILFVSLNVNAQLRPAQSQYLQEKGALINPSFEQGYKGWTITGDCTQSLVSDIPYLNKTLKLTCVNQSFNVKQNTDLSAFVDQQALITAQVKANIGGMSVSSLTNDVASSPASVIAGDYKSINIPVKVGSTSNGVEFSAISVTGEFFIDDVSLRLAPDLSYQVGQAQFVGRAYFSDQDCDWNNTVSSYAALSAVSACEVTTVTGNISVPSPATSAKITIDNFRTDGFYHVSYQGLIYNNSNTATCFYNLTKEIGVESENGETYVTATQARADNYIDGTFRFEQGDTGDVHIQAYNNGGGQCSVRGQTNFSGAWKVHFYPDSQSTIVSQQTELTAATANELSARVDGTVSPSIVSSENYDFINGNCTRNTTGNYTCNFNSGVFGTTAPSCRVSFEGGVDMGSAGFVGSCSIESVSTSSVTIDCARKGDVGASLSNIPFSIACSKQGNDVNKSQTIVGKFANINDTELCYVRASGNGGTSITASVTPIDFTEETDGDNCNAWNGTVFTPPRNGIYEFSGKTNATASSTYYPLLFINRNGAGYAQEKAIGTTGINAVAKNFQGYAYLTTDDLVQIRSTNTQTLNNNDDFHYLLIQEKPDLSAIVDNLSNNPRTARSDQYSETEIEWGLWNGQQLYRRCFTVASDITTDNTLITTFASGLVPKNKLSYNDNINYVIEGFDFGTSRSSITYNGSNGEIRYFQQGGLKVKANTSFCMDYTK